MTYFKQKNSCVVLVLIILISFFALLFAVNIINNKIKKRLTHIETHIEHIESIRNSDFATINAQIANLNFFTSYDVTARQKQDLLSNSKSQLKQDIFVYLDYTQT